MDDPRSESPSSSTRTASHRARTCVRLSLALAMSTGALATAIALGSSSGATEEGEPAPVPRAECRPKDRPETDLQGRAPAADYATGRAMEGYTCHTKRIGGFDVIGGFKVLRYVDRHGRVCGFYDSGELGGDGAVVLDMTDPAEPRQTAQLSTPAFTNTHESMLVHQKRGLLIATRGPLDEETFLDIYSVREDCRDPKLLSSTTDWGFGGHESGFSPDGRTLYISDTVTFAAVDLTRPSKPRLLYRKDNLRWHGMRVSPDGRTLYVAELPPELTNPLAAGTGGLVIADVSQIQDRVRKPDVRILSKSTWDNVSLPQVAEPFTQDGRTYLFEMDEATGRAGSLPVGNLGAGRIIDVTDPREPYVVSEVRLEVHSQVNRLIVASDPGGGTQGYVTHYCNLPRPNDPGLVACTFVASGLRVFDISDVTAPREIAYFNQPSPSDGSHSMSSVAWDVGKRSLWFSDINTGMHVVKLSRPVARLAD